ncbi:MAG: heme-copper oxidase subunit III [Candidatus Omnitrophica bacterium]|nr:heme-copper oxidase subunit III [Candidatus Omnitrophota bacterium]
MTVIIPPQEKQQTAQLGMMIALASWSMLFATALFGYTVLRVQATHWYSFGAGDRPFIQATANTLILLLSSVFYKMAVRAVGGSRPEDVNRYLWGTLACGAVFGAMQFWLWQTLAGEGIRLATSISASSIFAMTGLHAVHVLGAMAAVFWLALRTRRRIITTEEKTPLVLVGWFWHFLTIIWCVFYTVIFVIH